MRDRPFSRTAGWLFLLAAPLAMPLAAQDPAYPFPQHILYAAGTIRPSNFSQAQLDADVRAFYDAWKLRYVKSAGTTANGRTKYRIAFGKAGADANATVSEGQGYGMVILPLMAGHDPDAHAIFDGLYEFAKANPSPGDSRLMNWKIPLDAGAEGSSAFDGDADIAYGLMLAHAQWGSGGTLNYEAAANTWLAGILESTIGATSRLPTLGDWASPTTSKQYPPRSSDLRPGHFRAWARFSNNPVWNTVAANSSAVATAIQENHSATTGLLPDFMIGANPLASVHPAGPNFLEGAHDGQYYYNAGRVPWRIGVDALLNGDPSSKAQASKIATWMKGIAGGDAQNIRAGYKLDGTNFSSSNYFTTFFASPVGVAAMLDPANQAWLDSIYANVRTTQEDYFEDSVNLLCLLAMSSNFWDPTTVAAQPDLIRRFALPPQGAIEISRIAEEATITFMIDPAAARYAFVLERASDLTSWSSIATRAAASPVFQPGTAGVAILSQTNPVTIRDGSTPPGSGYFYRVRIVN